jgi:hypothetical protein
MFINFWFWCKVTEMGWTSSRMGGQSLLHSRNSNDDERIELPF